MREPSSENEVYLDRDLSGNIALCSAEAVNEGTSHQEDGNLSTVAEDSSIFTVNLTASSSENEKPQLDGKADEPARAKIHQKLAPERNEIRVLHFQPRRSEDPGRLCIALEIVSLDDHPEYHCISYFWGPPTFDFPIYVNGALSYITPTLGEVLSQLESEKWTVPLWADGLSINQHDIEERNDQVKKMARIYGSCKLNLAWLGRGDESMNSVMDIINKVGVRLLRICATGFVDSARREIAPDQETTADLMTSMMESADRLRLKDSFDDRCAFDLEQTALTRDTVALILHPQLMSTETLDKVREELLASLISTEITEILLSLNPGSAIRARAIWTERAWDNFFTRPFWRRIWMVQEMVLPDTVMLKCGRKSARFEYLQAIYAVILKVMKSPLQELSNEEVENIRLIGRLYDFLHSGTTSLRFISLARQNQDLPEAANEGWNVLHSMLRECSRLESTNPLDKIFGLISMSSDHESLNKLVDYKLTPRELGIAFMKRTLLTQGLQYLQDELPVSFEASEHTEEWPTWVNIGPALNSTVDAKKDERHLISKDRYSNVTRPFSAAHAYTYQVTESNFFLSSTRHMLNGSPATITPLYQQPIDLLRLPCREVGLVRRVCHLTPSQWPNGTHEEDLATTRTTVQQIEKFVSEEGEVSDLLRDNPLWQLYCLVPAKKGVWRDVSEANWKSYTEDYEKEYEVLQNTDFTTSDEEKEFNHRTCLQTRAVVSLWVADYTPFTISSGYVGIGVRHMKPGDKVVIFPIVDVPYILRRTEFGRYRLIGQAYVLGIMHGEFIESSPPEDVVDLE
ncbi:hypothetical protein BT63DRAFT_417434 [Microthyrium microscopicum]|uniref:Heterokaryon incompatibility domain-containing protein n=1 Tax=Microthyrium microscopicum TaxID=703497 RepID=A0A6A6U190_9PEZI|nr:hypothetical protein BT63DRAFT_417434 [Microthyrium microscopicum]